MTRTTTTTRAPRMAPGRRGVAMLMVVIALVVTTVLTTAILTAPDRMGPIADNAKSSAQARWSATSAGNFTVAAITEDVSAESVGGLFKDRWTFAGGDASSMVTNIEGDLPTSDDREVLVTVTSSAGGVSKTVQRRMMVVPPVDASWATDTRLGEIAVFATDSIDARSVQIGVWNQSPEVRSGVARLAVGDGATLSAFLDQVELRGEFVLEDPSGAASNAAGQALPRLVGVSGAVELPLTLPRVYEQIPSYTVIPHLDLRNPLEYASVVNTVATPLEVEPGRYKSFDVSSASELALDSGTYVVDECYATTKGVIRVVGDVRLVVNDTLMFHSEGRIVLDEGARLILWIGGQMVMSEASIGAWDPPVGTLLSESIRKTEYSAASSVRVFAISDALISLNEQSAVLGDIHAPGADVQMSKSRVYGRVTGKSVTMANSVVLYDPVFDSRYGFTNLKGPLYADGSPVDGLVSAIEGANGLAPDLANSGLQSTLDAVWLIDPPTVSTSGYSEVWSSKVPVDAFSAERERDVTTMIATIKKRYYAGLTSAEEAKEIIANLELGL